MVDLVSIVTNKDFYPRSPCGERRACADGAWANKRFLSTLSLRRATNPSYAALDGASISIHALLAESDWAWMGGLSCNGNFYPRSPCGERLILIVLSTQPTRFLSTLSLRRATTWARGSRVTYVISIHALLAESDTTWKCG